MYIPMPFPRCPQCGKIGSSGFHRYCGGELEIDPETEMVYCPKCGKKWALRDSRYYCSCGNVFEASEVVEAIEEMLIICRICMDNILNQQNA
ncbi:MAG: hypothetical protein IJF88_01585, partial [Oscillospiraceae bacterium]|nr:hypothetical protein [Oscillospiraceae bacterium]